MINVIAPTRTINNNIKSSGIRDIIWWMVIEAIRPVRCEVDLLIFSPLSGNDKDDDFGASEPQTDIHMRDLHCKVTSHTLRSISEPISILNFLKSLWDFKTVDW